MGRAHLFAKVALLLIVFATTDAVRAADLPKQLKIGDEVLVLNGTGARTKNFLKLYTAGLYLKNKSNQPARIMAADELMGLRIEITSGFVSQAKLVSALEEGFQSSAGGDLREIQQEINQFSQCFSGDLKIGDTFDLIYVPNHGLVVLKNGKRQGAIEGLTFKQALFGIWLSGRPVDTGLKKGLLGG